MRSQLRTINVQKRCHVVLRMWQIWGGGQPDSDMKVDFSEIGIGKIGKIGISDFFNLKLPILANFGKIGNKLFLEFFIFHSISATFIGIFVSILAKKVL